jgi:hypothetical protein
MDMVRSRTSRAREWAGGVGRFVLFAVATAWGVLIVAGIVPVTNAGTGEVVESMVVRVLFAVLCIGVGVAVLLPNDGSSGDGSREREGPAFEGDPADLIDGDGAD